MFQVNRLPPGDPSWSISQINTIVPWAAQDTPKPVRTRLRSSMAVVGADVLALALSLGCALLASSLLGDGMLASVPLIAFAAASLAMLVAFAGNSHYVRRVPFWAEFRDLVLASAVALLFTGFVGFVLQNTDARLLCVVGWLAFPMFAVLTRRLVRRQLASAGLWQLRTIIVGLPDSASETLAALQTERQLGYQVVAVVSPDKIENLPPESRWRMLIQHHRADLVVFTYDGSTAPGRDMVEALVRERIAFALMPQLGGLPVLGFEQTRFFSHDTVMFTFRNNLAKPIARFTKLAFDVTMATVGVLVLSPVLVAVAVLVKMDGGPALFGHVRIGSGGKPFRCLKFRSMAVDSEAVLRSLLARDPAAAAEWMQSRKLRNDPRITKLGRMLRATSLDELPQLFNVLRLEMSLVGPRPIVGAEVARYGPDITYYYETRPGLTGLWQVSGRTETSYEKRVQLDTWYVKNWTIWHDLAILAKTIPAVLKRRGAV